MKVVQWLERLHTLTVAKDIEECYYTRVGSKNVEIPRSTYNLMVLLDKLKIV